jgi:PAS domain S-box-containing protein
METSKKDSTALILVVDDDLSLLQAMSHVLKMAGHRVLEASSGREGLLLAEEHQPDMMVIDRVLPDIDGVELCRTIQSNPLLSDIQTILISSIRISSEEQADGLAAGAHEYIARPLPNREFLARVEVRLQEKLARDSLREAHDRAWATTEERKRELIQSEQALREAIVAKELEKKDRVDLEEELQAIFSNAPICLFLTDGDARIHKANPTLADMFGQTVEVLLGQPCGSAFNCVNRTDSPQGCGFGFPCKNCGVRRTITETFATGTPRLHVETSLSCAQDGKITDRLVSLSTSLVMVSGQKRVLVCMEDITERRQSEQALHASEEKSKFLADMLQSSSQPFVTAYADGRIGIFNPAYCKLVGYSEDELGKIKWNEDLTPPEWREIESQKVSQLIKTGQPVCYEKEYIHKDGRRIPIELLAHIRKDATDASSDCLYAFITDLTQRKRLEKETRNLNEQLNQAQKMESVGRLAGGVAHDFNNMLSVILGYGAMALEKTDPISSLNEDIQEIVKAAERSANITRQLLAFARKQAIAPQVLDLNKTVEGMSKMLQRLIGEDITLAWLPGSDLRQVKIDPSQIDQILANLCVNARDAITGVGKITIETGMATFDEAYCTHHVGAIPGRYVCLAVSDNGHGMDRETLAKIFDPFFTTKALGQGTGLGLSTVYGIVEQNNGFVMVYSELGKGTTFKIYLPQNTEIAIETDKESEKYSPSGQGETVLVVEDEGAILRLTNRMLTGLGYTVLTADNWTDALRLAHENAGEIRLLLSDVIMPDMNGRDLAVALLSFLPELKCLFMSGYSVNAISTKGVLDEGVNFIQKPFSMRNLAEKIREVLEA